MPSLLISSLEDHLCAHVTTQNFVRLEGGLKGGFKHVPDQDHGDVYVEVTAYEASRFLGFPLITITAICPLCVFCGVMLSKRMRGLFKASIS